MAIYLVTIAVFALVMVLMGVGVMLQGKCIKGTCGGEETYGPDGEELLCDTCPKRDAGECPDES